VKHIPNRKQILIAILFLSSFIILLLSHNVIAQTDTGTTSTTTTTTHGFGGGSYWSNRDMILTKNTDTTTNTSLTGEITSYWDGSAVNSTFININQTAITLYALYDAYYLHILIQLKYGLSLPSETCNLYLNNSIDMSTFTTSFTGSGSFTGFSGSFTGFSGTYTGGYGGFFGRRDLFEQKQIYLPDALTPGNGSVVLADNHLDDNGNYIPNAAIDFQAGAYVQPTYRNYEFQIPYPSGNSSENAILQEFQMFQVSIGFNSSIGTETKTPSLYIHLGSGSVNNDLEEAANIYIIIVLSVSGACMGIYSVILIGSKKQIGRINLDLVKEKIKPEEAKEEREFEDWLHKEDEEESEEKENNEDKSDEE
jgi:hypothetical protein